MLRNLIHGADTVMSHILHFYHLAAPDFVDASALGSPWDPMFGSLSNCELYPVTSNNPLGSTPWTILNSYVTALDIRREAHTMSAILSGRHPIQNAIVPGGATTLFTQSDINNFKGHLNTIRNFINLRYIPDVVFVATTCLPKDDWTKYWTVGTNPGHLLSYGEYPLAETATRFWSYTNLLIARGTVDYPLTFNAANFDVAKIKEYVNYSYYDIADNNKTPDAGTTTPRVDYTGTAGVGDGTHYSWLKAPRYNDLVHEVGPLARMVCSYLAPFRPTVSEAGGSVAALGSNLGSPYGTALTITSPYTARSLVSVAMGAIDTVVTTRSITLGNLYSPLGRHAARALECKFVADAMGNSVNGWIDQLSLNHAIGENGATIATGSGYTYVKIPKNTVLGTGLCEAPRGALGHWITIQSKKIGRYQCVVPSTWNAGPKGGTGATSGARGAAESALMGVQGSANMANTNDAVLNIARMLHPYDFCIACAVHLVTPEGKDIAKFELGADGTVTKFPVDSE